jgi:hypothetical protein
LSVQDFFSRFDWQGFSAQQLFENQLPELSWQCLTVEEFFSQNNWQGQPLALKKDSKRSLSLTLPVQEFFQFIVWEGNPQVAVTPQIMPAQKPTFSSSKDLTLNHLSDLF